MDATADTVDFFRDIERQAWKAFIDRGSTETLAAWMRAWRNLNDELNARMSILVEHGHVRPSAPRPDVRKERA